MTDGRIVVYSTRKHAGVAAVVLISGMLASASVFAADAAAPEPGVWQKHQYSFVYMGFTSTYSCDGLASKLKILLLASGARADAKSRAGACAAGYGRPDKFARADLTFYTLAPPDTSKPADGPAVNGIWRPVTLAARKPHDLATGDCELVEQFKSNVLPMFTTRNVESRTSCIPHQLSGSTIDLRFDAFGAAPQKK
jgi:hypothetical protein